MEIMETPTMGAGARQPSLGTRQESEELQRWAGNGPGTTRDPWATLSLRSRTSAGAGCGMESACLSQPRPSSSPHVGPPRHLAGATLISGAEAPGAKALLSFPPEKQTDLLAWKLPAQAVRFSAPATLPPRSPALCCLQNPKLFWENSQASKRSSRELLSLGVRDHIVMMFLEEGGRI